jgi:hypothetical protein
MRTKTTKMRTSKTRKRRKSSASSIHRISRFPHLISELGHFQGRRNHTMRISFFYSALLSCAVLCSDLLLIAQEPTQLPAPLSTPSAESSSQEKSGSASRHSDDFLVRGTVFTEEGLALPGAELRIRRASEKRFRWDSVSNSRGNFAVRVKMGADYEVVVRAKGFQEQSLPVDAKSGERFKDLVFRMQHQGGKKS